MLREDIRDRLIVEILGGQLSPGDRLIETRIAKKHGVSQAPVREALRDLEQLGFAVSVPFRGSIVRKMSATDVAEIYPLRAVLEGLAAREAATRIDAAGLRKLEGQIASMHRAAARGDTRAAIAADFAFHLTVVEASGNWLLRQFWERLRLATNSLLMVSWSSRPQAEIAEGHTPVLEAIRARDPAASELAMRSHIERGIVILSRSGEPGEWLLEAIRRDHGKDGGGPAGAGKRADDQ